MRTPKYPGDQGVPARVIGPAAGAGWLRVIVGPGIGQLDGGVERELPVADVPPALRVPNAELRLIVATDGGFIVRAPRES